MQQKSCHSERSEESYAAAVRAFLKDSSAMPQNDSFFSLQINPAFDRFAPLRQEQAPALRTKSKIYA